MWHVLLIPELQKKNVRRSTTTRIYNWKYKGRGTAKADLLFQLQLGLLGAVTKNLMTLVTKTGTSGILNLLQKACLLGTAKVLRRVLDT